MSPSTPTEGQEQKMIVYTPGPIRDISGFVPLGSAEALGGKVLEGKVELFGRIDFSARGMTAGLFMSTRGKVQILFPFTEHATILEGEVTLTDESGQNHTYRPGDSYFIKQGQVILWDVKSERVIKSFFNIVENGPK
ncbi:cupin domain-containing protein [Hyalangium rubrum]|uniref:Cupin domain-containing protein n=1 Tax=Hyalangium rubrum TaxID=3103134 RepID=A0ABU5H381_9BACT|nr:cupin domain-containing protein [Hyalangium sp. s54d21]MDY7227771.1 cupin domain-containing protein [Hyalangium sp. s54d21]